MEEKPKIPIEIHLQSIIQGIILAFLLWVSYTTNENKINNAVIMNKIAYIENHLRELENNK